MTNIFKYRQHRICWEALQTTKDKNISMLRSLTQAAVTIFLPWFSPLYAMGETFFNYLGLHKYYIAFTKYTFILLLMFHLKINKYNVYLGREWVYWICSCVDWTDLKHLLIDFLMCTIRYKIISNRNLWWQVFMAQYITLL